MQELKDRIRRDAQVIGGGILKVDGFINHRIDVGLMQRCGEAIAARFRDAAPSVILTSEASGIAPALSAAMFLGVDVVYARKSKPVTMDANSFAETVFSRTRQAECTIYVAGLRRGESVLVIDDFLASGRTIAALARITARAGARLVGVAALVEKKFEDARAHLSGLDVPIVSLATIASMRDGIVVE